MKIIFPFVYLDKWYCNRYKEQLQALSNHVDKINVVVFSGVPVDFESDKIDLYYYKVINNNGIKNYHTKFKHLVGKYMLYNYWGKIPDINRKSIQAKNIDGDIILGYSGAGWMELYHVLLGYRKNIPVVHRMRGYGKYERSVNNNIYNRVFNDALENISYNMYDYHIPISSAFRKLLLNSNIDESIISEPIGLGVDTNLFKSSTEGDYVGFIGRATKEKGIDFFLELTKSTPDINYLCVGINQKDIEFPDNVLCVGKKQKYDMPKYYDMCKVILMPSLSEGISNTIIESYSMGKPIICSRYALNNDIPLFGHCLDMNIKLWRKVLYDFNENDYMHISSKARQWALKNSWSSFGERMINELKKLM